MVHDVLVESLTTDGNEGLYNTPTSENFDVTALLSTPEDSNL